MIKVQKLSFSYPQKDLYNKVSFTMEDNIHCALIGSNGTGKSTLLDLLMNHKERLYDGKITVDSIGRIGYVSQFSQLDLHEDMTVFEYISAEFVKLEQRLQDCYKEMETAQDLETVMEVYQNTVDEWNAVDGENYTINIRKHLSLAKLEKLEGQKLPDISNGEFKLIQVIKEMMVSPGFLIMDEPDVFLDFERLNGLKDLINAHKGTLLVITHNRYLLNHCFNKILHMENREIQEFDGTYIEYNYELLAAKIEQEEAAAADQAEIERQQQVLDKARFKASMIDSATLGRTVHARQTLVDRLEARKTKLPYVDIRQPEIHFAFAGEVEDETVLELSGYSAAFDEQLLADVNFIMQPSDHVAIVGRNGTGKTTLLREILENSKDSIKISKEAKIGAFMQSTDSCYDSSRRLLEVMEDAGFASKAEAEDHLKKYGFEGDTLQQRVRELSGGEKDLFQLAVLSCKKSNLLLLDEPTGHLDVYAQVALEQAVTEFKGAVLMVSHDFYTVVNCMDYVLYVEDSTVRRMSMRKFRQMIYADHYDKEYLVLEQEKKETEFRILQMLRNHEFEEAKILMESLAELIRRMK